MRATMRARFREGYLVPPAKFGVPEIFWADGVDYASLEKYPESFKWWLACLGILQLVCTSKQMSSEDETCCRFIITDWRTQNPPDTPALGRSWDGHAVALRSEVFIEIAQRCADAAWLRPCLQEQMEFLADPANFQGNWNHGVDQARALIRLAAYLDNATHRSTGVRRLREALAALVDVEGVTLEQAIHYQNYNYQQVSKCLSLLAAEGVKDPLLDEIATRQALMPAFLAHATRPDGTWFEIGDTPWQPANPIPGTVAEYAATQGARGPVPQDTVRVYAAGYIFGRSGWGTSRAFADESAYAIRFGPPRIVHGHNDHMSISYCANGREILRDGGFHGYTDDDNRTFLRLAEAHNCVVPFGEKLRFRGCTTHLTDQSISSRWQVFTLETTPWAGVRHQRSFLIGFAPQVMIVFDRITADQPHAFEQRWFLGAGLVPNMTRDGVIEDNDGHFRLVQHLACDTIAIMTEQTEQAAPHLAGRKMYQMEPATLLGSRVHGRDLTFLTSFAFGQAARQATIRLLPGAEPTQTGRMEITSAEGTSIIDLLMDGRIKVQD